jgi:hypothetical protein
MSGMALKMSLLYPTEEVDAGIVEAELFPQHRDECP